MNTTFTLHDPYVNRRREVALRMGDADVMIIPTATEKVRNRDSMFPFRADSYFFYLTGFAEPDATLVLCRRGDQVQSVLFCQPKNLEKEIWDGYRLGPLAAPDVLGVDLAFSSEELESRLTGLLENQSAVWFPFGIHDGLSNRVEGWLSQVKLKARSGAVSPHQLQDACSILDELRLVKSPSEIATMHQAARISAQAHVRAMRYCAGQLRKGLDVREYHLEAELLHEFRHQGSQFPAYTSIVAAGPNACVLHYRADSAPVRAGDLVLIDAGCELDGYASDITRTFPANGRFSAHQRAVYEVVLAAQEAAISATVPGARFNDPHEAAVKVIAQGLLDLKLLDANKVGNVQDVVANRSYFPYYMHRTGHWLGMDVHDCGNYAEPTQAHLTTERVDPISGITRTERPSRILRPGMALTIEPGIYIRPSAEVPEAFHHIGIRIEDDAVVTAQGCELLSRDVPVAPDAIEALMQTG